MYTRPFIIPVILSCDPGFADLALAELRRARAKTEVLQELAAGVWLVKPEDGFTQLAEQWRHQPPIFVRHICPAHLRLPLNGTADDPHTLTQWIKAEILDLLTPGLPFSVQTRLLAEVPYKTFDVNSVVSQAILAVTQTPLDVRAPAQVVSIVVAADETHPLVAYLGISLTAHNLSDWAGGIHRFAREPGQISRSEFKLLEALDVFQIKLPAYGTALDLGAAPGGWTRILRQHKQYVTAVDPAELHPTLRTDTYVRHKRMTAETYLTESPDVYDLIVNDMRQDARDSARLMNQFAPYLYPHGFVIMTFKLPEYGRTHILEHTFAILRSRYHLAGARQLFHNRSEITTYLTPLTASTP